jgi:PAS domain S-box-containing protein
MKTKMDLFPARNPNPVLCVEKDGTVLYSNDAGKPLLREWGVRVEEKLPSSIVDLVQRVISQNSSEKIEVKAGNRVYSVAFHPLPEEECVNIYGFDITESRKAETELKFTLDNLDKLVKERTTELEKAYNSLKGSEVSLSEAQRMAHIGNWDWNLVTGKACWSDELYRIFGRSLQEPGATYDEFLSYVHPDDRDRVSNAIKRGLNGGHITGDYRIILANGEERIVHTEAEIVFSKENNSTHMKGTVQDITEIKRVEEQIKVLANIVESSNDVIGMVSLDGIITSWNQGAGKVYGYSVEEILGKPISILAPPHLDTETIRLIENIKQRENVQRYETLRLRKDGMPIYVSITLSPVFDTSGKLTAVSFISRDITKRKEAEEALSNFEIARKKEIHHRIKNNLQVIYSLLDLQAEKFKGKTDIRDSDVTTAFEESMDRVFSIALIHEDLYKGKNIDVLNFSQYIKELSKNLLLTYRLKTDVNLNFNLDENLLFDIDIAIPIGIIVNELVSNSLKYAFQGRDKGLIQIKLRRDETGECENNSCKSDFVLIVSDDGIGIPENLNIENLDSLGLQLVTSLVDQLDGELDLKRNNGTEFTIKFNVTEKNN